MPKYNDNSCLISIFGISILVVLVVCIPILILIITLMEINLEDWTNLTTIGKNLTQTIFFIATGLIAYFSYRQAKRSFFSPMKNEIFKKQIENLEEFKHVFGKILNSEDLYRSFRFEEIFIYNWMKIFAKIKEPESDPNQLLSSFRFSMGIELSGPEIMEVRLFPGYYREIQGEIPKLELSLNYNQIQESLKDIITSNLIPLKIQEAVKELSNSAEQIIIEIKTFLEEDYPNIETSEENNVDGATKAYRNFNPNKDELYSKYKECETVIRDYLNTDKIMN